MEKFVVTIGRQFGSMGRPIAKKAAEMLNINYYDRDIVEEAAKELGMPFSTVSHEEEEANHRFGAYGKMLFPLGNGASELQKRIFFVQRDVIQDLAEGGPCILVGRCADYIMKDEKNLYRGHIYAPKEIRIRNCVRYCGMTQDKAKKMCTDVDRARKAYHRFFAGYDQMSPEHVDFMLNSAVMGIDGTAELLVEMIRNRFEIKEKRQSIRVGYGKAFPECYGQLTSGVKAI